MKRIGMALLAVALLWPAISEAQILSALERLEARLREQLEKNIAPGSRSGPGMPIMEERELIPAGEPIAPDSVAVPQRGYLGVVADDTNDRGRGVRILQVRPGGPAAKAGLQKGDLITALGSLRVRQMSELAAILQHVPLGGTITVTVLRNGKSKPIEVQLVAAQATVQETSQGIFPPGSNEPDLVLLKPPQGNPLPPKKKTKIDPISVNRSRIVALENRVRELEQRIADLEAKLIK